MIPSSPISAKENSNERRINTSENAGACKCAYVGDVMGDLSKRRGRPMGMNPDADGNTVVEAEVPMAEMASYAIDLRAMTQARGTFTLEFVRYEEVPKAAQAKIIEDAKNDD